MSELRPQLGDFSSIVCFRFLVVGVEDTLGKRAAMVALKAAGRKRGHHLVDSLGLVGKSFTFGAVHGALEALYGVKLRAKQTGSILRGQDHDIVRFVER